MEFVPETMAGRIIARSAGQKMPISMPILMHIVKDHLYDTVFLPENMPNDKAYLFAIPVGHYAGHKIKTFEHTNMLVCGMLPAPESFHLREVKCAFYQAGEYLQPLPGFLHLERCGQRLHTWPLSEIADEDCKSLTCVRQCDYSEDFREYEDKHHPVIKSFEQHEHFGFVLELPEKPEIPTEFLVVLGGDHIVPVREMNLARS